MLSLIILVVAGAYIGLWYLLIRALPNRWAKAAVALFAAYVPFWDVPYGYYNFQKLCRTEAGLHIFATILPQSAVFLDPTASVSAPYLFKTGFSIVESPYRPDLIARISSTSPTEIQYVPRSALKSEYGIKSNTNTTWRADRLVRRDLWIYSLKDGTPSARRTDIRWFIWLQGLMTPILGTGWRCPDAGEQTSVERLLFTGTGG